MSRVDMESRRIASLDGLRTIAILAVVAFHYCYRWCPPLDPHDLYPYGAALARLPGVRLGQYGVQLFFVISGFVIAMTLERCRTPLEFAVRRYARLAPAMLLCSAITFAALQVIPQAPFPEHASWFVSSATFIDPVILNRIAPGAGFQSIDGVYWSLYIEVQFYVLACLVYFSAPRLFRLWLGVLSAIGCCLLIVRIPLASPVSNNLLIPLFLPWFVTGIGFHALVLRADRPLGVLLVVIGSLESLALYLAGVRDAVPISVTVAVPILFAAAIWFRPLAGFLAARPIAGIGVASYGLYLLHQNIGVAILHCLPPMNALGGAVAVVAVALGCTGVAVASFRWIETPLARTIRTRLLSARARESGATPENARAAHTTAHGRRLTPRMAPQDRAAGAR